MGEFISQPQPQRQLVGGGDSSLKSRLSLLFSRKFANIIFLLSNHKTAGSFGALAGFAVAVIFMWKFFRSTVTPQRRPKKETGSVSPSNSASNVSSSTENCLLIQNAKEAEPVDDFHPPPKLALGQIVKKKLNGSRKMTCQLLGVILEENSPEELQNHATVRSSVVEVLLEISRFCDVYLLERILDDESGERVILALDNSGLFKKGGLMKDKVIFCSTENGRSSFVRQLEPDWHVDTNPVILSQQAGFVRHRLHISPAASSFSPGSNIFCSTSLESYFAEGSVL